MDKRGSLVEPLSNGLTFSMSRTAIEARFGKPHQVVGTQLRYANFGVEYLQGKEKMNFVALQGDVKLNCRVGAGTTRQQVEKVFGRLDSRGDVIYRKYKLHFSQNPAGTIDAVTISPSQGTSLL